MTDHSDKTPAVDIEAFFGHVIIQDAMMAVLICFTILVSLFFVWKITTALRSDGVSK